MNLGQQFTNSIEILHIAVPSPLRHLFDYLPPLNNKIKPVPGSRVIVPFGTRALVGIIINITNQSSIPSSQLKPVLQILDQQPLFNQNIMQLFNWASNYYQYPIGMLFDTVLPSWLRKQKTLDIQEIKITTHTPSPQLKLNHAQEDAVTQVSQYFGKFQSFLLDGVTGSGKTEVYMHLIAKAIEKDLQTLILVPEINLTPQTLEHFQKRFQVPIAVLHSKITEKKRAMAWLDAKCGKALIVLGTRLAAFTPLQNPGLFIIDEEHDISFKQQDYFRYSARDLLLKRAQLEKCPIVLGTATPTLETWHNATSGKFKHLILPERAGDAQKPQIEIIDTRHKKLDTGLSNELLTQIKQHLDNKNQILIFINRRGYAPVLMCNKCGWCQKCKRCDSNMILHNNTSILRCHHCQAQQHIPNACPNCSDKQITAIGIGTQRLEECLTEYFPNAKITRVDSDAVRTKKQLQTVFDDIHAGNTDILIGTQMLAKGHHFPNLTLVAIIDIDAALFSADFRATERIAQLITQVAGRAGRGKKIGKVILQTTQPENHLLQTLIYSDYHAFLQQLNKERLVTSLPPYSYQVLLRAETKISSKANNFLQTIKELISNKSSITCFGPIAAPMEKRCGFYRAQLLLQAHDRKTLQRNLQSIIPHIEANKLARRIRWSIDVDPVDMF